MPNLKEDFYKIVDSIQYMADDPLTYKVLGGMFLAFCLVGILNQYNNDNDHPTLTK